VRDLEIGQPINSENCSETAEGFAREAKAEAGYRFAALYDKISREDVLAHAFAQCRSTKGTPGLGRSGLHGHRGRMACTGGLANWRLHPTLPQILPTARSHWLAIRFFAFLRNPNFAHEGTEMLRVCY
jgi:hypothetical protein